MNLIFLFGINEPSIWAPILAYLIVGLVGFAICFIHRYFVFAVMPLFIWLAYYWVMDLPNTISLTSMRTVGYLAILVDFLAIVLSAFLSWKKYRNTQINFS
jgi:hypothetical protein